MVAFLPGAFVFLDGLERRVADASCAGGGGTGNPFCVARRFGRHPAASVASRARIVVARCIRPRLIGRRCFRGLVVLRPARRKRRVRQQQLPDLFHVGAGFAGTVGHDATMAASMASRQGRPRRPRMSRCHASAGRTNGPSRPQVCPPRPDIGQYRAVEQKRAGQYPHPILRRQAEKEAVAEEPMQHGARVSWCNDQACMLGLAGGPIP